MKGNTVNNPVTLLASGGCTADLVTTALMSLLGHQATGYEWNTTGGLSNYLTETEIILPKIRWTKRQNSISNIYSEDLYKSF